MDRGQREALALKTIGFAADTPAEAIVLDEDAGLTRFTHNAVHQNLAHRNASVRIRTLAGGRTGVAATNALDDASLRAMVARSREIGAVAPRDDGTAPLVEHAQPPLPPGAYVEATATATPERRAGIAADIIATAERNALWAAGYVRTGYSGITVANSAGALLSFDRTSCALNVKQNAADSSGFAEAYANDVAALDGKHAGDVAADKALRAAAPIAVEPGVWTVILEPAALGELFSYLAGHFSAQAYDEGSSFVSGSLGALCAGKNVTLADDFAHELHRGMPFDFEGYSRRQMQLVTGGVATGVVTDAYWARRLGRRNTGHGMPAPSPSGPQALHLVVSGGEKNVERLIAETKRGLLISRFWYIRPVDQRKTIVTGMTRDGTFLIENGTLGPGVRNMRFNQSILEALKYAEFSHGQVRTEGYSYSIALPAVKFERFAFTSLTDF